MLEAASTYIEKNNKVLTIERESDKFKGFRSMPHGIVEEGELPEETAVRETFEETGYDIKVIRKITEYYGKNDKGQEVRIHIYEGKILSGELKDEMNPEWISKDGLLKRKDVVPSLKKAINFI